MDLLEAAGERALPCIPQLIVPLKTALDTRDPQARCVSQHHYRRQFPSFAGTGNTQQAFVLLRSCVVLVRKQQQERVPCADPDTRPLLRGRSSGSG